MRIAAAAAVAGLAAAVAGRRLHAHRASDRPQDAGPASRPEHSAPEPDVAASPQTAPEGVAVSGFPEPPGKNPGDVSKDPEPHHALNSPVVDDPDATEWPDPYETREDPRDPPDPDAAPFGEEPHPPTGGISTSDPPAGADPEAGDRAEAPKRDKLDD